MGCSDTSRCSAASFFCPSSTGCIVTTRTALPAAALFPPAALCCGTACSACLTSAGTDLCCLRPFFFDRSQHPCGLLHVLRLDPQDRSITPLPGCHCIAGRDVDLGRSQLGDDVGEHTGSILSLDQEPGLGTH